MSHRVSLALLLLLCCQCFCGVSRSKMLHRSTFLEEQSTLAKSDLRWKEKRILSKDLSDDEEKLFVGHIPDIEDVGVFHPIPVPSQFQVNELDVYGEAFASWFSSFLSQKPCKDNFSRYKIGISNCRFTNLKKASKLQSHGFGSGVIRHFTF